MDNQKLEANLPAKRILVVEDEFIMATALKADLLNLGYEVPAVVNTGEEAIRKAAELRPDLILMDIMLIGPMSGIDAAIEIRKFLDIPTVYLSAHIDAKKLVLSKAPEPFSYLFKPCTKGKLATTIEAAL